MYYFFPFSIVNIEKLENTHTKEKYVKFPFNSNIQK